MRHFILFSAIILASFSPLIAQVGIGNATPESTAVLDLSNSTNKGMLLPSAASSLAFSSTVGMLYFYNDNIYYRRSDGYNALSPWKFKFNGNISNDVYYNLGGNIGIGLADITISPLAPLHIELDRDLSLLEHGSFLIGTTTSTSLAFNSTKIQARDTSAAADLHINEQGGDVVVGSLAVPARLKSTKSVQQLHQPTGEYYDIMPTGAIIMWSGSTANIPTGYAICDGGNYARSDNNDSIVTPNLSGRFVVAAGDNGVNNYAAHDQGGEDEVKLTEAQMPSHTHSGSSNKDGSHSHDLEEEACSYDSNDNKDKNGGDGHANKVSKTKSAGNHNHTITIGYSGGNQAHENRPMYYALIYIMKL